MESNVETNLDYCTKLSSEIPNLDILVMIEKDDEPYEMELQRHPYTLKCWLRYIEHKKSAPDDVINMIYERSLRELPGSYKLWYNYLKLRQLQVAFRPIDDPKFEEVNSAFERALSYMHKMPRLWLEYLQFLMDQGFISRTRLTFDRALRSLPITQAQRIWKLYLNFLNMYPELEETFVTCFRRYLKLTPEDSEEFIDYLIKVQRLDEAARVLEGIINSNSFTSKRNKSKHQLWTELCDLISKNPEEVTSVDVEPIIRQGIEKYRDQVGVLWNSLADYYVRSKQLEKARNIYEEAMKSVVTVSDFTLIYDTYSKLMEAIIESQLEMTGEEMTEEEDLINEITMSKAEDLIERRDLLQNSVCLRQNPHNVEYWIKRVKLFEGKPEEIIRTYTEALQTIDPKKSSGMLHKLWANFAQFYEDEGQLDDARLIFDKGMNAGFKNVDELAKLVLKRVEMEERHKNFKEAIRVLQKAVVPVAGMVDYHDQNEPVRNRLYKSHKVWAKLADLEQAFGTYLTCKSVFSRMMDLRVATPQDIVDCALFHEEFNYFEEAFKAYERGIALFGWPNVNEIWRTYLHKFLVRYKGTKLERARDLFEQCLEKCPKDCSKPFYMMYANLEENHGQVRQAMIIYDRATRGVTLAEQFEMYNIYLKKASELDGLIATRPIYKNAIETLPLHQAVEMGLRFAEQETMIGEIDRARAIYSQCSEDCDPKVFGKFWDKWKDFEMKHGNEATLSEMLRVRRSVIASTNTQMNCLNAQKMMMMQTGKRANEEDTDENDSMKSLEKKARMMIEESNRDQPMRAMKFVRGETTTEELGELAKTNNPDEISIDEENEEEVDANEECVLERQEIPSKVFGRFIPKTDDDE